MSAGYDKLKAAVDKDCKKDGGTIHPEGCVACGGKCHVSVLRMIRIEI